MKDWIGNSNSIYKTLGATNHTDKERETNELQYKWKAIKGYEDFYEVSTYGEIRRKNGKILKPKKEKNGYIRYHLSANGISKSVLAHRVVAIAFLKNPNNYKTVNHKDEKKDNNRVDNLEWCDMSYQNKYGIGAYNRNKFKEKAILQYTKNNVFIKRFDSIKEAAIKLGLKSSSISCVCKGIKRYKSTGGYVFKYEKKEVK